MEFISKQQIQFVRSLKDKKVRDEHNCFVVEGVKLVEEVVTNYPELVQVIYSADPSFFTSTKIPVVPIKTSDLERISNQKTPNKLLAVLRKPKLVIDEKSSLILALDGIQDPGNLGTIIRTADWFGIQSIMCSYETVDCFNPKVVQATMGSLFRVGIHYVNLKEWFSTIDRTIYSAALTNSTNAIYSMNKNAVLIIGSEGKGISDELISLTDEIVTIPKVGHAESLNAAVAAGILIAEFTRQHSR